jgi:release factor glutamine methyltransferase
MNTAMPLAHTVAQALQQGRAAGLERFDVQTLVGHLLQHNSAWLLAHGDTALTPAQAAQLDTWFQQAADGVPLGYLLGEQPFRGLVLQVGPDVLVPRSDTEVLVDWALERLQAWRNQGAAAPRVADLGTGSGAIALAVQHACPTAQVTATDLSAAALAQAQANATRLGLALRFLQGAWWQPLAGQRFELLLSNPPYIAGDDPHLPALRHEPRLALTPEGDGLDSLRALATAAPRHLVPGGWLLLEHGFDQGPAVRQLLADSGFSTPATRHDLAGLPRCTGGRWAG